MAVRTGATTPYADAVRTPKLSRWTPAGREDWPVDLALAAAITALNVAGAVMPGQGVRDGVVLLVVLSAVAGLALVARRSRPLASFLIVASIVMLVEALGWQLGWLPWTLLFSGYGLGAHGSRRSALAGLGATLAAIAGLALMQARGFDSWLDVSEPAGLLLVWVFGRVVAHRRVVADEARRHAFHIARTSAVATEQAVLAERLRVARDLHDTVTNQLAVVAVHAAGHPDATAAGVVLARIEAGARASMDDLRRMLGALRQGDDVDSELGRSLARVTGWTQPEQPQRKAPQQLRSFVSADWPIDVALGLAVMAVNVTGSLVPDTASTPPYREPVVWVLALLAAISGAALIVRRQFPVAVLAVVFAVLSLVEALWWQSGTMPASLLIATYTVGAWAPLRRGALAMLAMLLASVGAAVVQYFAESPAFEEANLESVLVICTPWVIGVVIGRRRRVAERALQEAREAEQAHAIAEERAVADERVRVVRDLHDIVAHGLAAIAVESAVARRQFGDRDFAVIDGASHAALDALRDMLGVLQGTTPDEPAPGLAELDTLVSAHRATHGPVTLEVDPAVADESASLRLTVHRIVQEALTNVGRHAPGASATVAVRPSGGAVEVVVENGDRRLVTGGAEHGNGFGLAGMRERIALFGGALEAGPVDDGVFRVHARLPRQARC